ncbi:MAG TPA: hypothetical protein VIL71_18435 [Spirillospora sp.]
MSKQITVAHDAPSITVLEDRVAVLEQRVARLTEALRAMAATLDPAPPLRRGGGGRTVPEARPDPDLLPPGK